MGERSEGVKERAVKVEYTAFYHYYIIAAEAALRGSYFFELGEGCHKLLGLSVIEFNLVKHVATHIT